MTSPPRTDSQRSSARQKVGLERSPGSRWLPQSKAFTPTIAAAHAQPEPSVSHVTTSRSLAAWPRSRIGNWTPLGLVHRRLTGDALAPCGLGRGTVSSMLSLCLLISLELAPIHASAPNQSPVLRTISNTTGCQRCRIELGQVAATLGSQVAPINDMPSAVARDHHGRFYVLQGNSNELPMLFTARGTLIRVIGSIGDGPGEFRAARSVAFGPGDSVAVLDEQLRRVSVLTGEHRFVRSFISPAWVNAFAWLEGGDLVFSGILPDRERVGFAMHSMTSTGEHLRSFGENRSPGRADATARSVRHFYPLPARGLLAAPRFGEYALEEWRSDGNLVARWARAAPWFSPRTPSPENPFEAQVLAIIPESADRTWVLLVVPDTQWKDGLRSRQLPGGEQTYEIVDPDKVFDSVIELIDRRAGRVVTRRRFNETFFGLLQPSHVVRLIRNSGGSRALIQALVLHESEGPQ